MLPWSLPTIRFYDLTLGGSKKGFWLLWCSHHCQLLIMLKPVLSLQARFSLYIHCAYKTYFFRKNERHTPKKRFQLSYFKLMHQTQKTKHLVSNIPLILILCPGCQLTHNRQTFLCGWTIRNILYSITLQCNLFFH